MSRLSLSEIELPDASVRLTTRAAAFQSKVSHLYGATAFAPTLFGSPLGPINHKGAEYLLPRFISITPRSVDETLRVAIYAGYDDRDDHATEALFHLTERLFLNPEIGEGLNIALFPLVNLLGLHGLRPSGSLLSEDWHRSDLPEIQALARDARHRAYHLFVELVTAGPEAPDDLISVSLAGHESHDFGSYATEFLSSEDFGPFEVRFEAEKDASSQGPLSISEDLPYAPVKLRLTLPANWSSDLYREAVSRIARTLILRYRSHQSYGQHI